MPRQSNLFLKTRASMRWRRFFQLEKLGTTVRREFLAGLTTFVTMAYIIVINPKILEAAGMPFGPAMTATILTAFLGTLAMGLYAKRPFAVAPYMGENAFIAFTVVGVLHFTWQMALAAVFLAGVLFWLITLLRVRGWLAHAIPSSMKIAFTVGIGLFLAFIGLNEAGLVTLGVQGAPVHVGDLRAPSAQLAILGFLLTVALMVRRVRAALLISIFTITLLAFLWGVQKPPATWVSAPPSLGPVFLQLDMRGALSLTFLPVILTIFVMAFVDTMGTLIGLALRTDLVDAQGNLPEIEKPMLCDAMATTAAGLLGTSTAGAYIESATGIAAGGRSGLTAVFTACFFLLALFFAPFLAAVPACACAPALVVVGMLMLAPIGRLNFGDLTESVPAFVTIILMIFTYNLGVGMTAGFVTYLAVKVLAGRWREVSGGMWFLGVLSLLFFLFCHR